jgi:hypothetical protein
MKTLVNILGTGRCGSTLLDAMLGNDKSSFSCGEVYAWFRPRRQHHKKLSCTSGADPCPVWPSLCQFGQQRLFTGIFNELDVDFVIDSSKALPWVYDQQRWLPSDIKIFNIAIFKEPIELAFSAWKRGVRPEVVGREYCRYYSRLFSLRMPFAPVSYRELVINPSCKLKRICSLLDMPYWEGKEAFWKRDLHLLFGSLGVAQQIQGRQSRVYTQEEWPPEFHRLVTDLDRQHADDPLLSKIISVLHEREVGNLSEIPTGRAGLTKEPPWLYWERLCYAFRRIYPADYKVRDVNPIYGKASMQARNFERHSKTDSP